MLVPSYAVHSIWFAPGLREAPGPFWGGAKVDAQGPYYRSPETVAAIWVPDGTGSGKFLSAG